MRTFQKTRVSYSLNPRKKNKDEEMIQIEVTREEEG